MRFVGRPAEDAPEMRSERGRFFFSAVVGSTKTHLPCRPKITHGEPWRRRCRRAQHGNAGGFPLGYEASSNRSRHAVVAFAVVLPCPFKPQAERRVAQLELGTSSTSCIAPRYDAAWFRRPGVSWDGTNGWRAGNLGRGAPAMQRVATRRPLRYRPRGRAKKVAQYLAIQAPPATGAPIFVNSAGSIPGVCNGVDQLVLPARPCRRGRRRRTRSQALDTSDGIGWCGELL